MVISDSWLQQTEARGAASLKQAEFYEDLSSGHIDNTFDPTGVWARTATEESDSLVPPPPVFGVGVHLAPTSKRRHGQSGNARVALAPRRCRE